MNYWTKNQNIMVTVIIPALNEEKTICQVIQLVQKSPIVSEILVIDDKSCDDTILKAKEAKATVYTSTKLGKGASMRDGMLMAQNEWIVYLDADILTYPENIVEILTLPLREGRVDFVKSCFSRQAGRVTELVAKPLLNILFPELIAFSQPLSGMIAGKKSFLKKITFENDYGVDIGILIESNVLRQIAQKYEIDLKNIVAIGDGENDICMIKNCGIGISFCSDNKYLNLVADKIISEKSFASILSIAE